MVYFQYGLFHRHSLDPGAEAVSPHDAEIIQVLVIDPKRQDKVLEISLGDIPFHLFPDIKSLLYIPLPEVFAVSNPVSTAHIVSKEVFVTILRPGKRAGTQKNRNNS